MAQDKIESDFKVVEACTGDVATLCASVTPGEGRIKAGVKDNMTKLSPACVDAYLTAMAAERKTTETKPVPVPDQTESMTYTDLRGVIYCEVWLFRNFDEGISAVHYNTSALNNAADVNNTCPADAWAKVTVDSLEANFDILAAYHNGPCGWTMDAITLPVGQVETFDALQARWMGQGLLPEGTTLTSAHVAPYTPLQSHRKSRMTFQKGKPVFILEAP